MGDGRVKNSVDQGRALARQLMTEEQLDRELFSFESSVTSGGQGKTSSGTVLSEFGFSASNESAPSRNPGESLKSGVKKFTELQKKAKALLTDYDYAVKIGFLSQRMDECLAELEGSIKENGFYSKDSSEFSEVFKALKDRLKEIKSELTAAKEFTIKYYLLQEELQRIGGISLMLTEQIEVYEKNIGGKRIFSGSKFDSVARENFESVIVMTLRMAINPDEISFETLDEIYNDLNVRIQLASGFLAIAEVYNRIPKQAREDAGIKGVKSSIMRLARDIRTNFCLNSAVSLDTKTLKELEVLDSKFSKAVVSLWIDTLYAKDPEDETKKIFVVNEEVFTILKDPSFGLGDSGMLALLRNVNGLNNSAHPFDLNYLVGNLDIVTDGVIPAAVMISEYCNSEEFKEIEWSKEPSKRLLAILNTFEKFYSDSAALRFAGNYPDAVLRYMISKAGCKREVAIKFGDREEYDLVGRFGAIGKKLRSGEEKAEAIGYEINYLARKLSKRDYGNIKRFVESLVVKDFESFRKAKIKAIEVGRMVDTEYLLNLGGLVDIFGAEYDGFAPGFSESFLGSIYTDGLIGAQFEKMLMAVPAAISTELNPAYVIKNQAEEKITEHESRKREKYIRMRLYEYFMEHFESSSLAYSPNGVGKDAYEKYAADFGKREYFEYAAGADVKERRKDIWSVLELMSPGFKEDMALLRGQGDKATIKRYIELSHRLNERFDGKKRLLERAGAFAGFMETRREAKKRLPKNKWNLLPNLTLKATVEEIETAQAIFNRYMAAQQEMAELQSFYSNIMIFYVSVATIMMSAGAGSYAVAFSGLEEGGVAAFFTDATVFSLTSQTFDIPMNGFSLPGEGDVALSVVNDWITFGALKFSKYLRQGKKVLSIAESFETTKTIREGLKNYVRDVVWAEAVLKGIHAPVGIYHGNTPELIDMRSLLTLMIIEGRGRARDYRYAEDLKSGRAVKLLSRNQFEMVKSYYELSGYRVEVGGKEDMMRVWATDHEGKGQVVARYKLKGFAIPNEAKSRGEDISLLPVTAEPADLKERLKQRLKVTTDPEPTPEIGSGKEFAAPGVANDEDPGIINLHSGFDLFAAMENGADLLERGLNWLEGRRGRVSGNRPVERGRGGGRDNKIGRKEGAKEAAIKEPVKAISPEVESKLAWIEACIKIQAWSKALTLCEELTGKKLTSEEMYAVGGKLRTLMEYGEFSTEWEAGGAYAALTTRFKVGSRKVYQEARALRALMKDGNRAAVRAYEALALRFKAGSKEVYQEGMALRILMKDDGTSTKRAVVRAYAALAPYFEVGSPEVYLGGAALRTLVSDRDSGTRLVVAKTYAVLVPYFEVGSPEVYLGGAALRTLMKDGEFVAAEAYEALVSRFEEGSRKIYQEGTALRALMKKGSYNEKWISACAYAALTTRFKVGSRKVYQEGRALRALMEDGNSATKKAAVRAYEALATRFKVESPEVYLGGAAFRALMKYWDPDTKGAAADAYAAIASRFEVGSPKVYLEGEALRTLMKGRDPGTKGAAAEAYAALVPQFEVGSPEVYLGGAALRTLIKGRDSDTKLVAAWAYEVLATRFEVGSPEVYQESVELRTLMKHGDYDIKRAAVRAYAAIASRFEAGSPEVYLGGAALRTIMKVRNYDIKRVVADAYAALVPQFKAGSPEVYQEGVELRILMKDGNSHTKRAAVRAYEALATRFEVESPEVYLGGAALRTLMNDRDSDTKRVVAKAYAALATRFEVGAPEVYLGGTALRTLISDRDYGTKQAAAEAYAALAPRFGTENRDGAKMELFGLLALLKDSEIREDIILILRTNFRTFSVHGLWGEIFDGAWIDRIKLPKLVIEKLKDLAVDPYVRNSVNCWMEILKYFDAPDPAKISVLEDILTSGGKARKIISAMRAINNIPKALEKRIYSKIDKSIPVWEKEAEGKKTAPVVATRVAEMVKSELFNYLRKKVGKNGENLIFLEKKPEYISQEDWDRLQEVRKALDEGGVLGLLASAASFMDEDGIESIGRLVRMLNNAHVENGRVIVPERYAELGKIFDKAFVELWGKEYSISVEVGSVDEVTQRKNIIEMTASQIAAHSAGVDPKSGGLPQRVGRLLDELRDGDASKESVDLLFGEFEREYQVIKDRYGQLFANIRDDLRVLKNGLKGGLKTGKNATVEITGGVDGIAKSGTEPVDTCQRLTSLYSADTNGSGQPVNRILHGQFKQAVYFVDGVTAASHDIEITKGRDGKASLFVDRLYIAGMHYVDVGVFKETIYKYAQGIGIERENVVFSDDADKKETPLPLATEDDVYRDSWNKEVDPKDLPPFIGVL